LIELPEYKIPYLLKNITFNRKKHVLAVEITYFPMQIGFMYLADIMNQTCPAC